MNDYYLYKKTNWENYYILQNRMDHTFGVWDVEQKNWFMGNYNNFEEIETELIGSYLIIKYMNNDGKVFYTSQNVEDNDVEKVKIWSSNPNEHNMRENLVKKKKVIRITESELISYIKKLIK